MLKKNQKYYLEYLVFRGIETVVRFMPGVILLLLARFLGFLGFSVVRYRRTVALDNLRHAFPEKTEQERLKIARRSYEHFALLLLEFLKFNTWGKETFRNKVVFTPESIFEELQKRYEGLGFILVSGHFGNWEVLFAYLTAYYFPGGMGIIKRQHNPYIDQYVIELRQQWNLKLTYTRGAIVNCLKNLKKQRFAGLLCDQDARDKGVFVPFLNRTASTPIGAAVLHLRSGAPLVFIYTVRTGLFRYHCHFREIHAEIESNDLTERNIAAVTAAFTAELEKAIRQYPEQYLWFHKRWKTQPST
jgi:KDO2-lipid IV(A) lauroyltransferase